MEREHLFLCPHCGEQISMLLDLSEEIQEYIEDCEVCCRPIRVRFAGNHGNLASFETMPE